MRESANTLGSRVLVAADDEARVDLDRLAAAATRANVDEIECIEGIVVESIRDRVYLAGARDGRIPEAAVRRWVLEAPTHLDRCSDALRAWSWFWTVPLGQDFAAGRMTVTQARNAHGWLSAVNVFERAGRATVAGDSAVMANATIELAASVRGERPWCPDPFVASLDRWRNPMSRISLSNVGTLGFTIAEARNRHLAVRLAAEIILDARAGHPLPDNLTARIAAAAPEAAGGGALGFGLRNYRLSATRFRIGIDADGSAPVHADMKLLRAERWDDNSDLSTTHGSVFEIDVDPKAATPFTAPADEPVDRPLGAG